MGCAASKSVLDPYDDALPVLSGPRASRASDEKVLAYNNKSRSDSEGSASRSASTESSSTPPLASPTIVIHPPSCHSSMITHSPRTSWGPPEANPPHSAFLSAPPATKARRRRSERPPRIMTRAHLLAQAINYMPRDSLLALRAASKKCMEDADARLFHHIILDDDEPRRAQAVNGRGVLPWPRPMPPSRLVLRAPHGRLPCPPWSNRNARGRIASLLAHVRVLDYHCEVDVACEPALAAALRGVQVVRRVWPSPTVLAPTVVDYLDLSQSGYWAAAGEAPRIHPVPAGVRRVVLNIIYPTQLVDHVPEVQFDSINCSDLVLKFHPRNMHSVSRSSERTPPNDQGAALTEPRPFGFLGGLLTRLANQLQTSRITWVGLDAVPPTLLGLPPGMPRDKSELGCLLAMGVAVCADAVRKEKGWAYAEGERASSVWGKLHGMRLVTVTDYAREQTRALGIGAAASRSMLEDLPSESAAARLWVPAAGSRASVEVDMGPEPDRYVDQTLTALRHWRSGFDAGLFGDGLWGREGVRAE
ncbi:hypothetical protein A1Q1_04203 [Trichosporon asahii var. asahii CBS 2479]|uniref:Uncharacterized protein n=1 Tax=Trichosporon asahii var. asahii (strain ATCC 90039 / CBS 2479 / JCM 2466 / KCTC 7840 / NBRC 103889/ NCYC 2677 / UAMH 7654) TaxID=1186058 RepID=J4U8U9_TRIAS|nr:hypothetical protein A1Q1_04203 [Trichosporon asahii var. asahii CBS 2479]EJT46960.1 hypothetical protein A1Q1_04203 [Trichosporon asahii var. asahii CBS 2479]